MADIFDKCVQFMRESLVVKPEERIVAESVVYRKSPIDNAGPWIKANGKRVLQFSTNDYLGLARNFMIRRAATMIVERYGISTPMGSRALTGNIELHYELERQIAEFKRTEKALVFVNGAHTMMGTIAALASQRDYVIMDQYAHTSLVCGAKISGARIKFFRHNDVKHLEHILMEVPSDRAKMVVVDGVYSMHGDMAPLPEICYLCKRYKARLIVDDAHGNGVCGANGRGTAEVFGVEDQIDLHLGTFSKAFATMGGFAAGDAIVIDYLRYLAPTILFTKAMPACIAAATLESLKLVRKGHRRREILWRNARMLQNGLRAAGFNLGNTQSPITPVEIEGNGAVFFAKELFERYNIWACAALYPAVPLGSSRLRIIPTAKHTKHHIKYLINALTELRDILPQSTHQAAS